MEKRLDCEKLRNLLKERGLRQNWLAREIGVSPNTLSRLINDRGGNPRQATIRLLSRALKIPENEFMRFE